MRYIPLIFVFAVLGCSQSRNLKSVFFSDSQIDKANREAYLKILKNPELPIKSFAKSKTQIILCVENRLTCFTNFTFLHTTPHNTWQISSFKYRLCDDTIAVKSLKSELSHKWNNYLDTILTEQLYDQRSQDLIVKDILKTPGAEASYVDYQNDIRYIIFFRLKDATYKFEFTNPENYLAFYKKYGMSNKELSKLTRLKGILMNAFNYNSEVVH